MYSLPPDSTRDMSVGSLRRWVVQGRTFRPTFSSVTIGARLVMVQRGYQHALVTKWLQDDAIVPGDWNDARLPLSCVG